jgi:radical SAM protein with 4Fe4S-binding SPASM domain
MAYSPPLEKFDAAHLFQPVQDPKPTPDPDPEPRCPPHAWRAGGLRQVFLELTPACNSRCPGCPNESFIVDFSRRARKSKFGALPLNGQGWSSVISRLPTTLKTVILSGGEPTLHPEFLTILKDLENRQLGFSIFSNGRWQNAGSLVEYLRQCQYFRGFRISLHGARPATHEAFMGMGNSFQETITNIDKAISAKLAVTLSTVVTAQNVTELSQIVLLAISLGVKEISFNRYIYTPERLNQLEKMIAPPTLSQLQNGIRKIEALRQQFFNQIRIGYGPAIPHCFEKSASQGCSAGEASFVIDPWGNVKPCLDVDLLCGNILQQSFEAIWSSEPLVMWRGLAKDACSNCSALSECGGGCRAMALMWGKQHDPLMVSLKQSSFIKLDMIKSS